MKKLVAALLCLTASASLASAPSIEDMVKMTERQAAAVKKNAPDCDKIGSALLENVDADAAVMKEMVAADRSKTKEQRQAEQKDMVAKYGDRLKAAKKDMEPMRSCKDNANVKKWKAALDEATRPPKG